jgi:pyruvate kinase
MQPTIPVKPLIAKIESIRQEMVAQEWAHIEWIKNLHRHYQQSARNLVHYLTLRKYDLREIQEDLSSLGISSIGHSERYTLTNITNILHLLNLLEGKSSKDLDATGLRFTLNYPKSKKRFTKHTEELFSASKLPNHTRIMVTLPSEAATDYDFVNHLVGAGVEILRINCAHDSEAEWARMVENIRLAEQENGLHCLIYMDLAGPKLRTGYIADRLSKKGDRFKPGYLLLKPGEMMWVFKDEITGTPAQIDEASNHIIPAKVSVTLGEAFHDVHVGESISFDDGRISGVIDQIFPDKWLVRIIQTELEGSKLRSFKGINLPDSSLSLPSLTADDLAALPFIASNADMVGYSFVRKPSDVDQLQQELRRLSREDLGIILKIETKESFDNLPFLLLTAMRNPKVGVMIARGDLAVEVGWTRIAEVQEQITWLCEAAHIPYIWATQILETLAKTGIATRAEITDAAMAAQAECAMLNKGPYILEAVRTLRNIDDRMLAHHQKKMSALRPLHVAQRFFRHPELVLY